MAAKRKVDYERIEPDWRAGIKSPAQLATEYTEATGEPVSRVAIIKHFEKLGVPRDLAAKIKAKAESLVAASMVTGKVAAETKVRDAEIVEAGGLAAATVQLSHRADIRRARLLTMSLLAELEAQTGNVPGLVELGEILRSPNDSGSDRLNDIYRAVIALPERTKTMKALAESLKHLVGMEREAYGLDSKAPDGTPVSGGVFYRANIPPRDADD
ncbi:MAG: hypothetical protein RL030_1775 [Pseudomonadota bacterium]|jgi:hypothetical protein